MTSALDTMLIDGKPVGDCTAGEVRAWCARVEQHNQPIGWRLSGWTAIHRCVDGNTYRIVIERPLERADYRWSIQTWQRTYWSETDRDTSRTLTNAKTKAIHRMHQLVMKKEKELEAETVREKYDIRKESPDV